MLRLAPSLMFPTWRWECAFPLMIALVFVFAGCGDTCFVFISNPSNGTINVGFTNTGSACGLSKPRGAVQVTAQLARVCEACSDSNQIGSIWVALSGVELRPKGSEQELSEWRELLPQLETRPLEVVLMEASSNGLVLPADRVAVPAGSYDLVRLRFATGPGNADATQSDLQPCGSTGRNCVVMRDGRIVPILLDSSAPELLIPLGESTSSSVFVTPDSDNELLIQLTPVWSIAVLSDGAVRALPMLRGNARMSKK